MNREQFFQELRTALHREGFTPQPEQDELLPVEWDGLPLCRITADGGVRYWQEDVATPERERACERATDLACTVREYMTLLEQAPPLQAQIMPVFMLVYNDLTFRMIPFVASTKATFYRKVLEIVAMSDFDEVTAVFYCGEYYSYDLDQFAEINEKPYSERIEKARNEVLAFSMMLKGGGEMEIHFDEQQIDDKEYVGKRIAEAAWEKKNQAAFDWLNLIRQRLSSTTNPDNADGDEATK